MTAAFRLGNGPTQDPFTPVPVTSDLMPGRLHRIGISNRRIVSIDDGRVTFRYRDSRAHRMGTMVLPAEELLRRFLQHVLPRGFHKVRAYGLLSPASRPQLQLTRDAILRRQPKPTRQPPASSEALPPSHEQPHSESRRRTCGIGTLIVVCDIPARPRSPP